MSEPAAELSSKPGWALADTEQSIPDRFAHWLDRQPNQPAIAGTDWQPSLTELDAAAGTVAGLIAERNGAGGRVALLMDHDAPMIAAMLGVLRAGHSIVVLNPTDPPGRLDRIRRQVDPRLLIADHHHRDLARRAGFERIVTPSAVTTAAVEGHPHPSRPGDLGAVMYTSGSTGRPKGVMHTHHSMLHTALRHATGLGLHPGDRVALLASPSGGHGMGTTWMTLLTGATLCPFPVMDRGVAGLPGWLREQRITVLGLSASLYRRLIPSLDGHGFPELRLVRLGSEQVSRSDFDTCRRQLGEGCRFANVFSLTEAGGLAHGVIDPGERPPPGPLPVGRPAEGIEIQLLDERGEPVEEGAAGEIVVRSPHLSPGYWRDEELTRERFESMPTGLRTLRTGDLGHFDDAGRLVIDGRRDAQVKVRGYRVELSEVEAALEALPEIAAAAARAEPTRHGDTRLTAYVVTRSDAPPAPASLREALGSTLSEASIPTIFAFVDELPLSPHGKVDRERLASLSRSTLGAGAGRTGPIDDLEHRLSEIWAEALELERIGRDDDFFDAGGDSLAAAEIGAAVFETFDVEIEMRSFTRHPTVAGMAALVRHRGAKRPADGSPLDRVSRNQPIPCSFAQERIWRFQDMADRVVASVARLHGPIDLEALRRALEHVAARHEPLRTTFAERDGQPVQIIHEAKPLAVPLIDIGGEADTEERTLELLLEAAAEPFDLEHGPLFRFRLVRIGNHDHRLLRVSDHLVMDRGSWRIFFNELISTYEALHRGDPPPSDQQDRLQYADFSAWERQRLRPGGSLYRDQVAWWLGCLGPAQPRLRLPFARRAPAPGAAAAEGNLWWGIGPAVTEMLDRLGREAGTTYYAVRLALFAAALALEGEQGIVTVGAYGDNRRLPETRSMFGYFSNLLTLILPFDPGAPLRSWVAKVTYILNEASSRSELPYERLCDELRASGCVPPEIRAIFSVRTPLPNRPWITAEQPGRPGRVAMPWGFSVTIDQANESNGCGAAFDANLHDPAAVRGFIDRYAALADAAGSRPDTPLGDLHAALP